MTKDSDTAMRDTLEPFAAPCELIIFDCDGVLIDSEWMASRIDAEELTRAGFRYSTEEIVARFAGVPAKEMRLAIEAEKGRKLPSSYAFAVKARIEAAYAGELRAIDGAAELLAGLAVPFCVASSSAPDKLRLGLGVTGLLDAFEPHVFSATMVERGKPAPDLFLFAAERMGAPPGRTLVVEDSVAGVTAAVAAGMAPIGFLGGSHCGPAQARLLREAGARRIVEDHAELEALLCAWGA